MDLKTQIIFFDSPEITVFHEHYMSNILTDFCYTELLQISDECEYNVPLEFFIFCTFAHLIGFFNTKLLT